MEAPRKGRFSLTGVLWWAGSALLALSWLMPNHYLPWAFFHSEALAFMAAVAWLFGLASERGTLSAPRLAVGFPLMVLAVVWIQWSFGLVSFAGEAWLATAYLLGLAASVLVGWHWAGTPNPPTALLDRLVVPLICAGLVSTALSLAQWLGLEQDFGIFIANLGGLGRPFGNLGQPNLLATLMVMTLVGLVWCFEARRMGAGCLLLAMFFASLGLALTQSRAGYVAATCVCGWLFWKQDASGTRVKRSWIVGWVAGFILLAAALPFIESALLLADNQRSSLFGHNGRWGMWAQIVDGALQQPWLGYGWNSTTAAQIAGSAKHPGILSTSYAHNVVLDFVAWFGIPMGVLAFGILAYWWIQRAWFARGQLAVLGFALALPVLTHSMFEFPFAFTFFLFPVGVLAGVLQRQATPGEGSPMNRMAVLALGGALAGLGCVIVADYLPSEEDFRYVRFESMRLGKTPESQVQPRLLAMTQLDAMLRVGHTKPRPGMSSEALDEARRVARKYPWAPLQFRYIQMLEANGNSAAAEKETAVIRDVYGSTYYTNVIDTMNELRSEWKLPQTLSTK